MSGCAVNVDNGSLGQAEHACGRLDNPEREDDVFGQAEERRRAEHVPADGLVANQGEGDVTEEMGTWLTMDVLLDDTKDAWLRVSRKASVFLTGRRKEKKKKKCGKRRKGNQRKKRSNNQEQESEPHTWVRGAVGTVCGDPNEVFKLRTWTVAVCLYKRDIVVKNEPIVNSFLS